MMKRRNILAFLLALSMSLALLCGNAAAAKNPFSDVQSNAPYYDAVMWALETGVTAGTSATAFSPAATCNRGQVVTFLWRAAGKPEPRAASNPFSDVSPSSFCYKAVLWAVEQGITNGTTASTFSPGNPCTYAHTLTFLWRSVGSPEPSGQIVYTTPWYAEALAWAKETGVLRDASITPTNPCPRADIVSFLYRWARPSSLSRYPELAVDRTPIPEDDLQGYYIDGEHVFVIEMQGGEGDKGELLFLLLNGTSDDVIASFRRAGVNYYKQRESPYDVDFAVGFSRVDGVIYLDYYQDDVHMGKVPLTPFEDDTEDMEGE